MTSETKTETTVDNLLPDLSPLPSPENLPAAAVQAPATNTTSLIAPLTLCLYPRDLQVATLAPAVLGKDGVLWFDVLGRDWELIAVGDTLALTHNTGADSGHVSTPGFGLSANAFASIAAWSLKYNPKYALEVTIDPHTQTVIIKPQRHAAMGLSPSYTIGSSLFATDDVDEALQAEMFDRKLQAWKLKRWLERPEIPAALTTKGDTKPFDHPALLQVLVDARRLIIKQKSNQVPIHLHDGHLVTGGRDLLFWHDVPSLAGHEIVVSPQHLATFTNLLSVLPVSERCLFGRSNGWVTVENERTRIGLKASDKRHPADIASIRQIQPQHAMWVDADKLRKELEACESGEGDSYKYVWLHGQLIRGNPATFHTQGRSPYDGGQCGKGAEILCEKLDPDAELNFLAILSDLKRALTHLSGLVALRASAKSLYVSGYIVGRRTTERTAKLVIYPAETPERLARQVRRISSEVGINRGPKH